MQNKMDQRVEKILQDLAKQKGVSLNFVEGLPAKVPGFAQRDHDCRAIAIDANLPQHELIFTTLHEIAHFVLHLDKPYEPKFPCWIDRPYKSKFLAEVFYKTKRTLRRRFGWEWQADLWAFMAFPMVGTRDDLEAFFKDHPEKSYFHLLAVAFYTQAHFRKLIQS
jgi:hypothetical protein